MNTTFWLYEPVKDYYISDESWSQVTIEFGIRWEGGCCLAKSKDSGCSIPFFLEKLSHYNENRPILDHLKQHYPEYLI